MTIENILQSANEAYENRPTREINGELFRLEYFTYSVPGTNLSIYIIPVDRRISTRKLHLRYQFEINGKRTSRQQFEKEITQ